MNAIKKLLLEIIPVVIGILLALILNGMVEDYRSKKYFRQSLRAIVEENEHNIEEIEHALARQSVFLDTLRTHYQSDTISAFQITGLVKGFYSPDLKLTSWKFLLEDSKHTLIPIEMVTKLTDIEKYYNLINTRSVIVTEHFYKDSYFDKSASKIPMLVLLEDFRSDQQLLLKTLKEFKTYVKEQDF